MIIGVLSDIHNHIDNLKKAIEIFNQRKTDLVCFCGDLTSSSTISYFSDLKAPVKAVFGNMDWGNKLMILEKIRKENLSITYPSDDFLWQFSLGGKQLAIYHGHQEEVVKKLLENEKLTHLFTGHTHNFQIKKIKNTLWVNPGAVVGWTGLERRKIKPTIAIVSLEKNKGEIISL